MSVEFCLKKDIGLNKATIALASSVNKKKTQISRVAAIMELHNQTFIKNSKIKGSQKVRISFGKNCLKVKPVKI
jgi:hypothetical protein